MEIIQWSIKKWISKETSVINVVLVSPQQEVNCALKFSSFIVDFSMFGSTAARLNCMWSVWRCIYQFLIITNSITFVQFKFGCSLNYLFVRVCVCVRAHWKHGHKRWGDYPMHQAGGWGRRSCAAATVQQRGSATIKSAPFSTPFTSDDDCFDTVHPSTVCSVLLLWCRGEGTEEGESLLYPEKVYSHLSHLFLPVLSISSLTPCTIHSSVPTPNPLWLVILLHQLFLILPPCRVHRGGGDSVLLKGIVQSVWRGFPWKDMNNECLTCCG